MTLFTTSIRLIKAVLFGAIAGAKHELNVISWEKDMMNTERQVRPEFNTCVECECEITWEEFVCPDCAHELQNYTILVEDDDVPTSYSRDCICCDGVYGHPKKGELMCDHCLSQGDQIDGYGYIEVEDDDIPAECTNCIVCNTLFISGEHDTCSPCNSQLDLLGNKMLDHYEDGEEDKANRLGDLYFSLTTGLFIESDFKNSEYHMDTCCIEATGVCNCDLPF